MPAGLFRIDGYLAFRGYLEKQGYDMTGMNANMLYHVH